MLLHSRLLAESWLQFGNLVVMETAVQESVRKTEIIPGILDGEEEDNSNLQNGHQESEMEKRARMQEKHYKLLQQLQVMASELPLKYQMRLPYELLSDLANCMIDETVGLIVKGLKDIQHMQEKKLYEKRQRAFDDIKNARVNLTKNLKADLCKGTMTQEDINKAIEAFDVKSQDELHRLDMKSVMDLDQVVSEQQVTLEKTGVPGFHVTNNPTEVQLQMYILDFIFRLFEDSK